MRNTYKILVVKSERKTSLLRPRDRWEDNIGKDLKKMRWEDVDWMHVAQFRDWWRSLVNTIMNLRFP
jgi:hypothetical protein